MYEILFYEFTYSDLALTTPYKLGTVIIPIVRKSRGREVKEFVQCPQLLSVGFGNCTQAFWVHIFIYDALL